MIDYNDENTWGISRQEQERREQANRAQTTPPPALAPTPYTTSNLTNYGAATGGGLAVQAAGGNNTTMQGPDSWSMYLDAAKVADPFSSERGQYVTGLRDLMTKGSTAIAADPSYQNRLEAGQQALERSQAAKGFLGSGNMAQALVDYGQKAASDEYQAQYNRLSTLAGVDKSSPTAAAQIMALAPGQRLNEQNTAFNWNTQSAMLPYEMQAANIQNQMLSRSNTEAQQAFNKNQYALEQQATAPVVSGGGNKVVRDTRLGSGYGYTLEADPFVSTPATDEQIALRRRALGLI